MSFRCKSCERVVWDQTKTKVIQRYPDGNIAKEIKVCKYCEPIETQVITVEKIPGNKFHAKVSTRLSSQKKREMKEDRKKSRWEREGRNND